MVYIMVYTRHKKSTESGLVVERDKFAALFGEAACQSGFSRLPRAANCDDSSVPQRGADLGLGNAQIHDLLGKWRNLGAYPSG